MKTSFGVTRIVFIFDSFVIKIPNYHYSHSHFLQGCCANWSERNICKMFKPMRDSFFDLLAPSLFCTWFGLLQIQKRTLPLERDLTDEEKEQFKDFCGTDNKKENFGYYQGRIVCHDYP